MRALRFWITAFVCGVIIWISTSQLIGYYRDNFPGDFVQDRASWGAFGDYFGGIMNPILGLLNLCLLIYISYLVSRSDRQFALYGLRHEAIKEFVSQIDGIEGIADYTDRENRLKILDLYVQLDGFFDLNRHLFPSIKKEEVEAIRQKCEAIYQSSMELKEYDDLPMDNSEVAAMQNHHERWQEFLTARNAVLRKMQQSFN